VGPDDDPDASMGQFSHRGGNRFRRGYVDDIELDRSSVDPSMLVHVFGSEGGAALLR
jgi:hypothetical protein